MLIKWNEICTSAKANVQINMMSVFFLVPACAFCVFQERFRRTFKQIQRPTSNGPFKEKQNIAKKWKSNVDRKKMQFFLSLKGKHKLPIYGCICIRNDFQQFVVVNSFFPCYKYHLLTLSMLKKMQTKCAHHFFSLHIYILRKCNFQRWNSNEQKKKTVQWVEKTKNELYITLFQFFTTL